MSTLTLPLFDTLQYVKKLRAAKVPEEQAEAQAEALRMALDASLSEHAAQLATKGDIAGVKSDIIRLEGRMTLLQWMLGAILGGVIALVFKAFF